MGAEAHLGNLSRRQRPLNLQAYSLLPHKGQKGTGEEIGSWSQGSKAVALQRGKVVGVSQVLGPRGHEAAFAPESNQDPRQMCREGRGQSWEEGMKCPFLCYLQT